MDRRILCIAVLIGSSSILPSACDKAPETGGALSPFVDPAAFEAPVRAQVEAAQRAVRSADVGGEAHGRLGMLYHAYDWLDHAAACYRRAARLDPDDPRWWYYLGRIQAERGETSAAVESVRRACTLEPDLLAGVLFLGELLLRERQLGEAETWFARARRAAPQSAHALFGLGEVRFENGDMSGAAERYRQALEISPHFGRAHYRSALAWQRLGDTARARHHLERHAGADQLLAAPDPLLDAVRALRQDTDQLMRRAAREFAGANYRESLRLYRKAAEQNPSLAMARYNIARCLQALGRDEEAASHYEDYLRLRPDSVDALNNLGLVALGRGLHEVARQYFERAVAVEPRYYKGHFNLGISCERTGRTEAAIEHFRRAVSVRPRYAEAHLSLARLLERHGPRSDAKQHYLEVLRIDPGEERAYGALLRARSGGAAPTAAAYRQLANELKQERLFEAAVLVLGRSQERGDDWRNRVALAWMLATCPDEALRRPAEALELVEPVCRDVGAGDPIALDTLAAAYAALGRFDDAAASASLALLAAERADSPAMRRLAGRITVRLELYRSQRPYYEE